MINLLLCCLVSQALASTALAASILTSGDTRVVVAGPLGAVRLVTNDDRSVVSALSGNGVVLQFGDGVWSGEGHGRESLQSRTLTIDGIPTNLRDGENYSGDVIKYTRVIQLDNTVRVTHTLTVSGNGYDHSIVLSGHALRGIQLAYLPAETRSNRFTEVELRRRGVVLDSATTSSNNGAFYRPVEGSTADAILQFDPVVGDGVVTRWANPIGVRIDPWVWDRTFDNKLYLLAPHYSNSRFPASLDVSVRFCDGADCYP
ncbi:MAG: hypothetical protein AB8G23_01135 [Myxococcota bacterium]